MSEVNLGDLDERIHRNPEAGGCWIWKRSRPGNYGRYRIDGKTVPAHCAVYSALVGPIPDGLEIDHLCRNRQCVNPAHLEAVTHRENMLRSVSFVAVNAAKKLCKRGHALAGPNLRVRPSDGARVCLICRRKLRAAQKKRRKQRRRAASK